MNRFIRLAKLDILIKEAAKKSEDVAALESIFMNNYQIDPNNRRMAGKARGLAQQYYDRFIVKSDPSAPVLTADTLPQPLPDTIDDLKELIRSVEVISDTTKFKALFDKYPDIKFDELGIPPDYMEWLSTRYVDGKTQANESLIDINSAIEFLKLFLSRQNKFKSDPEFKKKIVEAGFSDIAIKKLTIEDIKKIISLDTSHLTVKVEGVEIKDSEYLGKFGEWNLWLPHTKETSTKIAGYDPVTYEPDTAWCTGRTSGSNLFYNYIGLEGSPVFLFYVIKDNPVKKEDKRSDNDWFSVGFQFSSYYEKMVPDFSGTNGGRSVNRSNIGLTSKDVEDALGDQWPDIERRMYQEMEKFKVTESDGSTTYESPAKQVLENIAKDIDKFKEEFAPKSNEEKAEFSRIILQLNPPEEVKRAIYNWKIRMASEHSGVSYSSLINDLEALGYDDLIETLASKVASKKPVEFLRDLFPNNKDVLERLGLNRFISIALINASKSDPEKFINHILDLYGNNYIEESKRHGIFELLIESIEKLFKETFPDLKFVKIALGLGLHDKIKESLKRAIDNIDRFYYVIAGSYGLDPLFEQVIREEIESVVEQDPEKYFSSIFYYNVSSLIGDNFSKSMGYQALKNIAERKPERIKNLSNYFSYYDFDPSDFPPTNSQSGDTVGDEIPPPPPETFLYGQAGQKESYKNLTAKEIAQNIVSNQNTYHYILNETSRTWDIVFPMDRLSANSNQVKIMDEVDLLLGTPQSSQNIPPPPTAQVVTGVDGNGDGEILNDNGEVIDMDKDAHIINKILKLAKSLHSLGHKDKSLQVFKIYLKVAR